MKKFFTAILACITAAGMLVGCGAFADIGRDEATEIALMDAGLTETDITRLRVSKDRDDGRRIYEIKFTSGNMEYEYEILASNGNILTSCHESYAPDFPVQNQQPVLEQPPVSNGTQAGDSNGNDSGTQVNDGNGNDVGAQIGGNRGTADGTQTPSPGAAITREDAVKLALDRVPGATEQNLKIESDYEDGRLVYEGDIIYDGKEYDFEIDAATGSFLEWSEER